MQLADEENRKTYGSRNIVQLSKLNILRHFDTSKQIIISFNDFIKVSSLFTITEPKHNRNMNISEFHMYRWNKLYLDQNKYDTLNIFSLYNLVIQ